MSVTSQPLDAPIAPPLENHSDAEHRFRWARRAVLLLIAAAALQVRAQDLNYSTGYMDETVYVLYGRMFLTGNFEEPLDTPLRWSYGWYLWPVMAATAEKFGGIPAVRALGALLGTLTVFALYGFARRLFTPTVGLASAAMFALLGPAVFVFRIATRDAGALFFFAVGLWLYARAWQERERMTWLAAAAAFFAAFLCKYLVALFFPFLALLALRERRHAFLNFGFPLAALCALYAGLYVEELVFLFYYSGGYEGLRAAAGEAMRIYGSDREDFWALFALSLLAWRRGDTQRMRLALALWLGAFLVLLFQWASGADHDYWKHVNYALLFLIPLGMAGFLRVARRWSEQQFFVLATLGVLVLSVGLGWAGGTWRPARNVFWPNVEPALAFFENRLHALSRVLVDDSVFRYYLRPALGHQLNIVDPFHFVYPHPDAWRNLRTGAPAYASAVRDGRFDYIVLNGGMSEEAREMARAIRPALPAHYTLRVAMPQPDRGPWLEIYERTSPPALAPPASPVRIEITSPQSGAVVRTEGIAANLEGVVLGAPEGAFVRVEVFTNRWYPQGARVELGAGGRFAQTIHLGGGGAMQCAHVIRARLLSATGQPLHSAAVFSVTRAETDGSAPACFTSKPPGLQVQP